MPTRDLRGVWELGTPGVRKATEAALGGVQAATLLSSAVAGAQDVALLLLGSPLHSSASAGSTSAGAASASATPPATATAASSSTAATEALTSATTPTPTPSSSPTTTTAALTTSSSSLAPLGLAGAASLTRSIRSADRLSANEVDRKPSGPYLELVGCLMYLITCTRPELAYPLSLLARYVAPGRHRKRSSHGYTFSLGSGSVSWRSTRSSSVLSSSCEAEIYAEAMAA
ncbi:unnamed protein product [Closterium sp. NIES-53]